MWIILLICKILWNLHACLIDVETTFLHSNLTNDIYIDCPEGMTSVNNSIDCLELLKCIYGLVQAARQFFRKLKEVLGKLGFKASKVDPCLLIKRNEKGVIFVALYVDDCLCVGSKQQIEELKSNIQGSFAIKINDGVKDYLSCEIYFSKDKKGAVLHQRDIIDSIEEEFKKEISGLTVYKTPGTPGKGMVRNPEDSSVSKIEEKKYIRGVSKLLYLVKHTQPDIANAIRELSKMLDCVTPSAIKELKRVIKYVLDTRELGLKIKPVKMGNNENVHIEVFCNSDYAGDKETRVCLSRYILYFCNVPVAWRSKAQKNVTLSSSKGEFFSLNEAAKEVKFIVQVIELIGIEVKKPATIRVDNIDAIYMAKDSNIS